MRIDGLMSLSGVYDNAKLGLDYQTGFQEALQRAKEKQTESSAELKSVKPTEPTDAEKAKEEATLRQREIVAAASLFCYKGLFERNFFNGTVFSR